MPISKFERTGLTIDEASLNGLMLELESLPKTTRLGLTELTKFIAYQMAVQLIKKTPTSTGATVTHWVASTDGFSARSFPKGNAGFDNDFVADIEDVIEDLGPWDKFFMTNNDRHFFVLEKGKFVPTDPGRSKDPFISPVTGRPRKGKVYVKGGWSKHVISKGISGSRGITSTVSRWLAFRFGRSFRIRTLGANNRGAIANSLIRPEITTDGKTPIKSVYGPATLKEMREAWLKNRD